MDIDTILKMTPEEFAAAWDGDRDVIINTCLEELGFMHGKPEA